MNTQKIINSRLALAIFFLLPVVSLSQGLEIETGASVEAIGAAKIEIDNGSFINNGTYTKGSDTLIFSGNSTNQILGSSNTDFHVVKVTDFDTVSAQIDFITASNLSLLSNSTLTVEPGKKLTLTNEFVNSSVGDGLVIESDATNSGSLIIEGTSAGEITYNRHVSGGSSWHLVASSVVGQDIWAYCTLAENEISSNSSMLAITAYSESSDDWETYPTSDPSQNFVSGKGYSTLRDNEGTVSFTGTVNTDDVLDLSITRNGQGWNLLGNPYPSAINATTTADVTNTLLNTDNVSNLDASFAALYLWDAANAAYKTITNAGGGELGEDYIQAGQGFFVRAKDNSSRTFDISEAMQAHQPGVSLKSGEVTWPKIKLSVKSGEKTSSTIITFNREMTTGLDVSYDAGMFKSNSGLEIYSRLVDDNGVDFAVQCLPDNDIESLVIPVGLDINEDVTCTFSIEENGFDQYPVYLLDNKENAITNLKEKEYTTLVTSSGTARFSLVFNKSAVTSVNPKFKPEGIKIFAHRNYLTIINPNRSTGTVRVLNILGQEELRFPLTDMEQQRKQLQLRNSYYIVQVLTNTETISTKMLINGS